MRLPLPIVQSDAYGCEDACLLQALYLLGLAEPPQFEEIIRRINRPADWGNTDNGGLRVGLEFGAHYTQISTFDNQQMAADTSGEYLTSFLRNAKGASQEEIDAHMGTIHQYLQIRAGHTLQIAETHAAQITQLYRAATPHDLSMLLNLGGIVEMKIPEQTPEDGYRLPDLVLKIDESGMCSMYCPDDGGFYAHPIDDVAQMIEHDLGCWSTTPLPIES